MNSVIRTEIDAFASLDDLAAQEEGQTRQAALLLHAMTAQDQAWMLSRLQPRQAQHLQGLLNELRELGLPRTKFELTPRIVEKPIAKSEKQLVQKPSEVELSTLQKLEAAGSFTLFRHLKDAPIGLVVVFLRSHDWSWRDAFIESFDLVKKRRLKEALKETVTLQVPKLPSKLIEAMWDELLQDLLGSATLSSAVLTTRRVEESELDIAPTSLGQRLFSRVAGTKRT